MATYYLNYFLTCIFLSSFSRILVWLLLKLTQTSEMLVITTIHIVAIWEHNSNNMACRRLGSTISPPGTWYQRMNTGLTCWRCCHDQSMQRIDAPERAYSWGCNGVRVDMMVQGRETGGGKNEVEELSSNIIRQVGWSKYSFHMIPTLVSILIWTTNIAQEQRRNGALCNGTWNMNRCTAVSCHHYLVSIIQL